MTYEELDKAIGEYCHRLDVDVREATGNNCGTGSWWEQQGYEEILLDTLTRLARHRKRVVKQDALILAHVNRKSCE